MRLARLVDVSNQVAGTRSRLKKRAALSECLREAEPGDVGLLVHYLTGTLPQGRIGLGHKMVMAVAESAAIAGTPPTLTLREVDTAFEGLAARVGKGSQQVRRESLAALFSVASEAERDFLARLILGELRQGALEGVLVDAIADAAALPSEDVRRADILAGQAASVDELEKREGR
jgi:DNA ligase-1